MAPEERPDLPLHYPLLVTHILFGSVALVTACLQIWPWLRRTHPAVHRWSGRAYLFGGVFPGGLAVLAVAPVSSTGAVPSVGNTALAVLWLITGVAGYRAARPPLRGPPPLDAPQRRADVLHRGQPDVARGLLPAVQPVPRRRPGGTGCRAAAGASVWSSWVVNLLVVEWWVLRPQSRRCHRAV
ncbi:DUF2306 domain-containing protein [Pseudonocardia charpentierae]|uniref:DUF2306 domain-containing protein n=1 Tax=Pseudonocardia charpentierae TaxID=3075545 RepID=A0ABU2NC38_9PSEU|nr:DUF2306 domain-containing protein [Pseudonocardia sp. DSM 45834]MDT0351516.1 DUF2306 domain-containing protein [Pseudonocardia sp. DSM 45834]